MGLMQRRKGADAERELARLLTELLGNTVTRNLQQSRDAGADLDGTPYALEVKRAQRARLAEWWQQACTQAARAGRVPVLAWRLDRCAWQFMLPLGAIHPGFNPDDHGLTVVVGLSEFTAIVRESLTR